MFELLFTWILTMGVSALACLVWLAINWPLRSRLVERLPVQFQPSGSDR